MESSIQLHGAAGEGARRKQRGLVSIAPSSIFSTSASKDEGLARTPAEEPSVCPPSSHPLRILV